MSAPSVDRGNVSAARSESKYARSGLLAAHPRSCVICLMAGVVVVAGGCGGGTQPTARGAAPARTSVTTTGSPSAAHGSLDQHRAERAVGSRVRRSGYRVLSVKCETTGQRRYDCRVNGAQLWRAVIAPGGSVHLRLLGSE